MRSLYRCALKRVGDRKLAQTHFVNQKSKTAQFCWHDDAQKRERWTVVFLLSPGRTAMRVALPGSETVFEYNQVGDGVVLPSPLLHRTMPEPEPEGEALWKVAFFFEEIEETGSAAEHVGSASKASTSGAAVPKEAATEGMSNGIGEGGEVARQGGKQSAAAAASGGSSCSLSEAGHSEVGGSSAEAGGLDPDGLVGELSASASMRCFDHWPSTEECFSGSALVVAMSPASFRMLSEVR